jgi:hypothetical protein
MTIGKMKLLKPYRYDTIEFILVKGIVTFKYKGEAIAEIELPYIDKYSTVTVCDLDGYIRSKDD